MNFDICEKLGKLLKIIGEKGALLVTRGDNVMTVGWSLGGVMWGEPVMAVPVRHSRYSHELLEKNSEFTVFVPTGEFSNEIKICGTKSGRDTDKIAELGLKIKNSDHVDAPEVIGDGYTIHCKVIYKNEYSKANMADEVYKNYLNDDFHTLYFARVVAITN